MTVLHVIAFMCGMITQYAAALAELELNANRTDISTRAHALANVFLRLANKDTSRTQLAANASNQDPSAT